MQKPTNKQAAVGGIAAVLALATPLVMKWEGKRNDPYKYLIGVKTVCWGETNVKMRRYTDAECTSMLRQRLSQDYIKPVLTCAPDLIFYPNAAAASASLAYNIGSVGFCKSTAARLFNAGDIRGGCNAIARFNKAGGRVIPGLVNRRRDEVALCLKDAK